MWRPGDLIAQRYKLERRIGEGGMGVVWAAHHIVTRKPVALKVLKTAYVTDKAVLQRFLREARASTAVRHPNVVQIYDVMTLEDETPVMVMDLLDGESLGHRIQRQRVLPILELMAILQPVVSAVAAAHAVGIVHRDLKPDNIFLAQTGSGVEVKVLDFGIAKLTASEGDAASTAGLTGTGVMLGTPYYMAPEQIYGDKDVDHRADLWAIGVILYECLAGVRPTQADSIGQILKIVTKDGITPLRVIKPDLPPDLLDLVDRLLSADRNERPNNIADVANVLYAHTGDPSMITIAQGTARAMTTTGPKNPLAASASDTFAEAPTLAASTPATPATFASTTTTVGKTQPAPNRTALGLGVVVVALAAIGATTFVLTRPPRAVDSRPIATSSTAPTLITPTTTDTSTTAPSIAATVPTTPTRTTEPMRTHAPQQPSVAPSQPKPPPSTPTSTATTTPSIGGVFDKPPF